MKKINAGVLSIAYLEVGPADGTPVFLMHGFPYDVHAYDEAAQQLSIAGCRCIVPYLRGYGPTTFRSSDTLRSGQQAALATDLLALMDGLGIAQPVLAGYDWGGRAACIVAALWPERVRALVSCGAGYNIQNIAQADVPAAPENEYGYWYQYYFQTERGRAGLSANRRELCELLWKLWSPSWQFDSVTFEQSAASFNNPDFVEVVIHSYRHRFGKVAGDLALAEIEDRLAAQPLISVPTIVLHGQDDGVDRPSSIDCDARHFTGQHQRVLLTGAGHNLPQEAPTAFAKAILSLIASTA